MVKRLLDIVLAALGLVLVAPVLALAALGIRLASPGGGPVFYRARRVGRAGACFTMYKLRTMHQRFPGRTSRITGQNDPRVFPLGALLRRTKIDELPQLFNVLRGDMSIVGPRPEDPDIVERHYTHGDALLAGGDPETAYIVRLLPLKVALDVVYVRQASLPLDVRIIGRTLSTIAACLVGRSRFGDPPEAPAARALMDLERTTCDTNA